MVYTVFENRPIGSDRDGAEAPANGIALPDAVFQRLRQLVFSYDDADALLTFSVVKGRECIRVRGHVGILPLSDKILLEILPKIDAVAEPRKLLVSILRHLRNGPFRSLPDARTGAALLPLWELFVQTFLDAVTRLVQQGVQRAYVTVEGNERFWKGKFQLTRHLRENACHAERLAVSYEQHIPDVPPNRLLKTTLCYLRSRTDNPLSQRRIDTLLAVLTDVSTSENTLNDLRAIRRQNRLFSRYETALQWAEALLGQQGFGTKKGGVISRGLLFPMERLFEAYVGSGIRKYWPESGEVTLQESSAHLIDEHVGSPKFKLRPDILIRHPDRTLVLDTKWKAVDGTDRMGSYGIEQTDMYQLFAYGKKYAADDLFLLYPANPTFQQPLAVFGYDSTTRLHVVPFNLANSLAGEVEKLAAYALSVA